MTTQANKNPVRLISEVEYEHGLEPGTLASRKWTRSLSRIRRDVILQLRADPFCLAFQEIARLLQRDHTSVIRMIADQRKKPGEKMGKASGKTGKKRK